MDIPEQKEKFKLPVALIDFKLEETPVSKVKPKRAVQVSLEGKRGSRVDPTKYRGNGHWQYKESMGGAEYVGFIYVIRDVMQEKLYLGKKQYRSRGKETKGLESNWRWYISSSDKLAESIKTNGKTNFEFVCIEQFKSLGMLSYAETWSLMYVEAPYRQDKWYNRLVNKVSWPVKEPISDSHKERLNMMMKAAGV